MFNIHKIHTHQTQERHNDLEGNTSSSRSRRWAITLNNYTDDEYNSITNTFLNRNYSYIIGKEVGENGTPHLQIYIECKNAVSFNTIKRICNRFHIEKAVGNKKSNIAYCSKEHNFCTNFCKSTKTKKDILLEKYKNIIWKNWQQNIIDIIETEPDDRTINWIWEPNGNIGKSFLCKYLVLKYDAIIADGKKDNIFNQIKSWFDNKKNDEMPTLCIVDTPRYNKDHLNYGVLEQIKNGMIYSGKYEGGICLFNPPHVFVFSNNPPIEEYMSEDRWNIIEL